MSKRIRINDGLNDTDIAALFATDNREPSAALDQQILANAHNPQSNQTPDEQESFLQRYAPLFGSAAVLMIAFALTPLNQTKTQPHTAQLGNSSTSKVADSSLESGESGDPARAEFKTPESDQISSRNNTTDTLAEQSAVTIDTGTVSNTDTVVTELDSDAEGAIADEPASRQGVEAPSPTQISQSDSKITNVIAESAATLTDERTNEPEELADTSPSANATPLATQQANEPVQEDSNEQILSLNSITTALATNPALKTQNEQAKRLLRAPATTTSDENNQNNTIRAAEPRETQPSDAGIVDPTQSNAKPADDISLQQRYRKSPLLWVIEIKRLYNDDKQAEATEELALFRKEHPASAHERLLPAALKR